MSNRISKKTIDNSEVIPTIPQTKAKPQAKAKPKPKHEFSEAAREGWEAYQKQREDNKTLSYLNKKLTTKTQQRREALKQKLINNPIFINNYKGILEAYNDDEKKNDLEQFELDVLQIFEYKPLQDKPLE
jgi:hypothetical protein